MNSKNMHLTELGEYIKLVITTLNQTLDTLIGRYDRCTPSPLPISYTVKTTIPESNKRDMYSLLTPTELEVGNVVMDLLVEMKTSNAVAAKIIYYYDAYDSGYKLSEFITIAEGNMGRDIEYRIPIYADFKNQNTTLNEFLKLFNKDIPRICDLIATMEFVTAVMITGSENGMELDQDDIDRAIQYHLHKYITKLREKRREG
jgi:hypothetical protein